VSALQVVTNEFRLLSQYHAAMPRKHKLDMPDYSVIIAIDDDDSVAVEIAAHPDIAEDVGNAVMKLLESEAGTPIVEACTHPHDQRLQDAAKSLLNKCIKIVQPQDDESAAAQEDQME
jgi:hypothetical protein